MAEVNRLNVDRLWRRDLPLVEHYGRSRQELNEDWWLSCLVPWYEHRFAILSRTLPAYLPYRLRLDWFRTIDDSGWVDSPAGRVLPDCRAAAIENTHQEYRAYLDDFRLGGAPCEALREELELCRKEGIRVALLLMPEGRDFRSWYKPESWERIEQFLADLRTEFDVPLINAREWMADECFSDSHHLLSTGAVEFTERLGEKGLLPLLQGANRATAQK